MLFVKTGAKLLFLVDVAKNKGAFTINKEPNCIV